MRARLSLIAVVLVLGAQACGSSDEPAPAPAGPLIAGLGDSITAGAPLYYPDPAAQRILGDRLDPQSQWEYWALRRLHRPIRNCGVAGERTDQIAARLDTCAQGASAMIVQGGTNDLLQGIPAQTVAGRLLAMVRSAKAKGLRVGIVEVIPIRDPPPNIVAAIADLNIRIAGIARSEGVRLIRWHHLLEDPAQPGAMLDRFTTDGIHPTVAGYRLLGEAITVPG
jgi:lysophospholipase L1-like esterase